MPYANVPDNLQDKMESCVQKVTEGGAEKESAIAICYTSVVEGKSLHDAYKSFFLDATAIKAGRMISAKNKAALQQAMDIIAALVADEAEEETEEMSEPEPMGNALLKSSDDVLIAYGSAIKSIAGKPTGYAVRFGGADLTGDTFSRDTNFGFAGETTRKVDILLHHAQPLETKTGRKIQVTDPIGQATLKMSDDGVLIDDAIIFNAEKYARHLDKLGWSTGAAAHSVVRDGGTIKQWQIAEVSLTPIPAEPRNMVAAKSLAGEVVDIDDETLPDFREIGRQVGEQLAARLQQIRQTTG